MCRREQSYYLSPLETLLANDANGGFGRDTAQSQGDRKGRPSHIRWLDRRVRVW